MRRPLAALALLLATALLLAACGSEDETATTPVACKSGEATYVKALAGAPDEVLLEGETPISGCIVPDQQVGDLSDVGATVITAATRLNAEAQRDPGGAAAAAARLPGRRGRGGGLGHGRGHTDLVRRLDAAARYSEQGGTLPAEFERAYGEGYAAAREAG